MHQLATEFLDIYFENISKYACYSDYVITDKKWTEKIVPVAKWSIYQALLNFQTRNPKFGSSNYDPFIDTMFRIDAIGYFTKWWINYRKGLPQIFDWLPVIAFEHENGRNWDDELSKLCHICADLKVISSFYADMEIGAMLKTKIDALSKDVLFRYPTSNWLFIFGPRKQAGYQNPFRAFTINSEFNIVELKPKTIVAPSNFKQEAINLDPPLFKNGQLNNFMPN